MFRNLMLAFAVSMVFWLPWLIVASRKERYFETQSTKIIREAKAAGRVVTGHLVKAKHLRYDPEDRGEHFVNKSTRVTYEYEINGCTHRWTGLTNEWDVPKTMAFYWPAGKPHKANPEGYTIYGGKTMLKYCLPFVVWVICYYVINWIRPS